MNQKCYQQVFKRPLIHLILFRTTLWTKAQTSQIKKKLWNSCQAGSILVILNFQLSEAHAVETSYTTLAVKSGSNATDLLSYLNVYHCKLLKSHSCQIVPINFLKPCKLVICQLVNLK